MGTRITHSLFLLLTWTALASDYRPGQHITWAQSKAFEERWFAAFLKHEGVLAPLTEWVTALDREVRPALSRLLADPETNYFYGAYNDPALRPRRSQAMDGGYGLRLIGQLQIGPAEDRRLLLLITFWDFDPRTQRLRLLGGPDSLRVLSEIDPGNYAGLSYEIEVTGRGKIRNFKPGIYSNDQGHITRNGVDECAGPDHCNVCHGKAALEEGRHVTQPYPTWEGHDYFLEKVEASGVSPARLAKLRKQLDHPQGLVESLRLQRWLSD